MYFLSEKIKSIEKGISRTSFFRTVCCAILIIFSATPTVYSDGSYTFTTNVSGLYVFAVNYAKESDPSYYYAQPLYINVLDPEEFDNNPIALYEHYYTQSPNPILIDVMANDIRGNDDGQLASPIITYPIPSEYGSLTPMGNQFLFTPAPDFYGVVPFAYEICETPSNLCATGVVNIFVLPPDLDHIIANDNVYMVKANKSLTIEAPGVLNNDMMASGGSITASRPNITSRLAINTALQGELNLHLDGSFTYEAPADYNGTEVVEYEVCDEEGQCYKATLYILVTNANPLPVELRYFELVREGTQALLRWETTEEIKFSHFEVERSFDGRKWHSLSKILAIGMPYHYQYSDENPVTGLNYYRLKMVDQDNRFEYSEIKSLEFDLNLSEVAISPNPAVDKIKLHIQDVTTIEKVQLLSSGGQVVFQSSANFSSEINVRHLPAGVYLVVLTHQGGRRTTHKVLIN